MANNTVPGDHNPAPFDESVLAATRAEIRLDRLKNNCRILAERAGQAGLMAVVKANAYGHGVVPVARVLSSEGVNHFAVATLLEAIQLRKAGITDRILVMGAPFIDQLPFYLEFDVDLLVSNELVGDAVIRFTRANGHLRVHPKVDTGMGRVGMPKDEFTRVVKRLVATPQVTLGGLWTHFSVADEMGDPFTEAQSEAFLKAIEPFRDEAECIHIANSAWLLRCPEVISGSARMLVRTGLGLYGYSPLDTGAHADLVAPVMRFHTRVTQVKTVAKGTTISYGKSWVAPRTSVVATLSVGYADGYPRGLSNIGTVGIHGQRFPVVGRICMDMCMVNLGPPRASLSVTEGDEAVLWGDGGPSVYDVAGQLQSIPYVLTCGVTSRVIRDYVD